MRIAHVGTIIVGLSLLYYAINVLSQSTTQPSAGGHQAIVSLVYELQPVTGVNPNDLAEQTIQALKNRLDPNDIRHVEARTMGKTKIEIEMPLPADPATKQSQDAIAELKRLIGSMGVLEFHILADSVTTSPSDLHAAEARLSPGGKGPDLLPGDKIRWIEVDKVEEFDRPGGSQQTHEWEGKHFMPLLVTAQASMDKTSTQWGLKNARPATENNGGRAISFVFDATGGKLFADLTTYWHDFALKQDPEARARLGIVLDDKLISAPSLQSAITGGNGEITGGGVGGFSAADQEYLVDIMNAGSLPTHLTEVPNTQGIILAPK